MVMSVPKTNKSDLELFYELTGEKHSAEAAFAELYRRHASRIFAYCHRIMGSYEQAQDAFQETFIRFYKSAQASRQMTNIAAYLLRIARNICLNTMRAVPHQIQESTQIINEFHGASAPYSLENKELLQLISMALELLPENYREVFVLREYDGFSYSEIAEILGQPTTTVKVRIFRAKQRIREILAPYLKDLSNTQ